MRTAMRPRYYCDHCKKGSGSPSAMKRHETGCTANPNRICGMCRLISEEGGDDPAPPRDELVKVLDASGFDVMKEVANHCPACILAAIRTKIVKTECGEFYVSGPEDGRQEWSFAKAKEEFWIDYKDIQAEKNYPGY